MADSKSASSLASSPIRETKRQRLRVGGMDWAELQSSLREGPDSLEGLDNWDGRGYQILFSTENPCYEDSPTKLLVLPGVVSW